MKNYVIITIIGFILTGCSMAHTDVVYGSGTWYQQEMKNISADLQSGKISQSQYEALKNEVENQHLKWRAGARRGVRP